MINIAGYYTEIFVVKLSQRFTTEGIHLDDKEIPVVLQYEMHVMFTNVRDSPQGFPFLLQGFP